MRFALGLVLWLVMVWGMGCAPSPVLETPCEPACAPGSACVLGSCYVAADGGPEAAVDAPQGPEGGADAAPPPDAPGDAAPRPDAPPDAVAGDSPPACAADLQRDPMNCGRCGNVCAGGCWRGVCQPGVCPLPAMPGGPACTSNDGCAPCLRASTNRALVPCCNRGACALVEPSGCP